MKWFIQPVLPNMKVQSVSEMWFKMSPALGALHTQTGVSHAAYSCGPDEGGHLLPPFLHFVLNSIIYTFPQTHKQPPIRPSLTHSEPNTHANCIVCDELYVTVKFGFFCFYGTKWLNGFSCKMWAYVHHCFITRLLSINIFFSGEQLKACVFVTHSVTVVAGWTTL